ncbi:hypothetical protein E9993_11670 [Labilibacter sediminis]|nr:hypothetical protein E9993_11670 [Labilibacter sediminis]
MEVENSKIPFTNVSHLTLRRNLGILGISLPVILYVGNCFCAMPSISAFYYSQLSVVFTGYLFAFGLFLFSYKGYNKEDDEKVSDNWLTNIAGILIVLVALIPTRICDVCTIAAPNEHNSSLWNWIHTISAASFLVIMGWMAYTQFTKTNLPIMDNLKLKRNKIYRFCAWGVWIPIVLMGILNFGLKLNFTGVDVFIGESVALFSFGVAWLVKSKALEKYGV